VRSLAREVGSDGLFDDAARPRPVRAPGQGVLPAVPQLPVKAVATPADNQ
jgi:hypothetical protein